MASILGAGGAIGSEFVKELTTRNQPVRLVSRNPQPVPGAAEVVAADLSNLDDTVKAVSGSKVATKSTTSSIQRNSRRRSDFTRLLTPKASKVRKGC